MKFKLLLIFLFSSVAAIHSQTKGAIIGKVTDKSTNAPISYVTISLKSDGKIITGGITDDLGNFNIKNLEFGKYDVDVQYMGYKTYHAVANVTAESSIANLGSIILEDEALQLSGVTVIAERSTIEQKIDRKVINVGKDLTTAGATASEIMANIPSVNVDQDGKLSLRGNENVRVLVDGRPTNIDAAQLLKQIPSTSIKKIELITNPSAKYNPEGMSGIINIVLHKNASDGFNASVNGGITFAKSPKVNSSINMNYRVGKVNFFGTYGNNFGDRNNTADILRLDADASRQFFNTVSDNNSHLFKVGMDYYIDDRNTVSIYTNQNFYSGGNRINLSITGPITLQNLYQNSFYDTDNQTSVYNFAYKHLFKKEGETVDLEVNYNKYKETQDASFASTFADPSITDVPYKDDLEDGIMNTTVNIDYVNPINKRSNLELGAEARIVRTDNDYTSTNDALQNSVYQYDLDIYSAYATFGQKFDKVSYQLGARFESYKVDAVLNGAQAYKDDYVTLYPSASFVYSPNEKNQFQLSYSRRVDRPDLEQTKPVREFSTPRVTSIGNPELDPQFTNSLEINYTKTIEKGSITAGIFGRSINSEINRVLYPDPENPQNQIMSFDNFDNNTAFGFELSANYKITKWWDVQPSIDYSNISQKGLVSVQTGTTEDFEFVEREVSVAAFNARINSNFKATKSLRFLLFGFYRGPVDGIQFNTKEMFKIDAGGRYSFLKDKATLSIRFNDIFDTMKYAFTSENPYAQRGEFRWESQSVYVGFNYMFGTGKNKALQRKQREDNTKQNSGGMF